jgi:hypothetical protein
VPRAFSAAGQFVPVVAFVLLAGSVLSEEMRKLRMRSRFSVATNPKRRLTVSFFFWRERDTYSEFNLFL